MNRTIRAMGVRLFAVALGGAVAFLARVAPADDAAAPAVAAESGATAATEEMDIKADAYEFEPKTGQAVGDGNVSLTYQDMVLTADHVELNSKTKDVAARGNITFRRGVFRWEGDAVSGNMDSHDFTFGEYRSIIGVWYAKGSGAHHSADGKVDLSGAQLSTCEYFDGPHYSIQAKRVTYYPNGKFVAYHTVYRVGGVPVFYFPVIIGDTDQTGGNIEIKPGYDSDWGAFLLLGREWKIDEHLRTKIMLHLRSKRGLALGNQTSYDTDTSHTEALLYGMRDQAPPETEPDYNRGFDVEPDRYRAKIYHRQSLLDNLNLRLRVDSMSDIDMLEDWFRREYRGNPQPTSFGDLTYEAQRFSLSLSARPRVNEFNTEVETLPELRLELPRQPLWDTGLYYQGSNSVAHLEMKWRDFDKDRGAPPDELRDYETWRADTLHMFYLPLRWDDIMEIVPRAGFRATYYDQTPDKSVSDSDLVSMFEFDDPNNIDPALPSAMYDDDGHSRTRVAGELGLELKTKHYRTWQNAKNDLWQVDGLRHVLEPYVNYTAAPKPSVDREDLYFFDQTDRLIEQNFVRFGLNQRLQTRRDKQIYTLASMNHYADFHFAKEGDNHHLGDIGTRVELTPKETVKFWGMAVADMGEPDFNRAGVGMTLGKKYQLTVGYQYRNLYQSRSAYSMGSSLVDFTGEGNLLAREYERAHYLSTGVHLQLTDKTAFNVNYDYDIEQGDMARQTYEVVRDLHCWMGALRLEEDSGTTMVGVVLYLKAFPGIRLDTGI